MLYLKRFAYSLLLFIASVMLLLVVYSLFAYFEVFSGPLFTTLILIISLVISNFYLGSFANKKGYLEGVKFASVFSLFTVFLFIFFKPVWSFKMLIYYGIVYLSCIFGSIIGINKKKEN